MIGLLSEINSLKDDEDDELIPIGWHIVYMLHVGENPSIIASELLPWRGIVKEDFSRLRHYKTCRLCERKPHTDLHILLECNAHPKVVDLRRKLFQGCPELARLRSTVWGSKELMDEIRARPRGELRRSFLPLVYAIKEIYDGLPEGRRKVVTPDKDDPASVLFVRRDSTKN